MEEGTDRPRERRLDEGYGTALCIADHQPGWLVLWVGVRGATPVSHSVAMGLLPWQQQSNSLANITLGPSRESRVVTLTDSRHQIIGLALTERGAPTYEKLCRNVKMELDVCI